METIYTTISFPSDEIKYLFAKTRFCPTSAGHWKSFFLFVKIILRLRENLTQVQTMGT